MRPPRGSHVLHALPEVRRLEELDRIRPDAPDSTCQASMSNTILPRIVKRHTDRHGLYMTRLVLCVHRQIVGVAHSVARPLLWSAARLGLPELDGFALLLLPLSARGFQGRGTAYLDLDPIRRRDKVLWAQARLAKADSVAIDDGGGADLWRNECQSVDGRRIRQYSQPFRAWMTFLRLVMSRRTEERGPHPHTMR